VRGTLKNEPAVEFFKEVPCFEKISTLLFAISIMWLGPAATWGSGAKKTLLEFSRIPSILASMFAEGEIIVAEDTVSEGLWLPWVLKDKVVIAARRLEKTMRPRRATVKGLVLTDIISLCHVSPQLESSSRALFNCGLGLISLQADNTVHA
jgi:hypothetical protein